MENPLIRPDASQTEASMDLQQSRMVANLTLCLVAVFLAFTQLPNLLIIMVIAVITCAVVIGRGGLLVFAIPLAITVNGLIGTGFQRGENAVQLPDLVTSALTLGYLAMACTRLELGRTSLKSLALFSSPQPLEQRDRYRLRPLSGLWTTVLVATLLSFLLLQWLPFRNIAPTYTGLIPPSTRMLLLIWAMAGPYLIVQAVFRRLRWRQQGPLESRMHVLQTMGDYLGSDQDAVVRRRNRQRMKASHGSQ